VSDRLLAYIVTLEKEKKGISKAVSPGYSKSTVAEKTRHFYRTLLMMEGICPQAFH
jgi:hypothetical protein